MKKVNTVLLNTRMREIEEVVQLGTQMATYEANGVTIEGAQKAAKEALGLSEDAILLIETEDALKSIQKQGQRFIAFRNAINTAQETGAVTEADLEPLEKAVQALEQNLAKVFNIEDIEDLYEEGE